MSPFYGLVGVPAHTYIQSRSIAMHINRRQHPRVDVALKCHVAPRGVNYPGVFLTENISRGGLLLRWDPGAMTSLPEVGDLLTVEIELPANHDFRQKCIHCQATVTRISPGGDGAPRVALLANYMNFRNLGARPDEWAALQEHHWTV